MMKIKVLLVDDSVLFREVLSKGIAADPAVQIIATAGDPFEARDKIIEFRPDVMICDVEMPKMNGIEFLYRLLPQYALPVIVISTISNAVFDAMSAGAVDFVAKPDIGSPKGVETFITDLIDKIKVAARANLQQLNGGGPVYEPPVKAAAGGRIKLIAIGASTGGTEAVYKIARLLPNNLPGMVVVQHIPPVFSRMFAERLNGATGFRVNEAKTGDLVESGQILIAPGDRHMKIKKLGNKFVVDCLPGPRVNGHCPSVDVLFESVAKEARQDALGVILTGMGYDGAKGLLAMRRNGARTIGQDESSCVVYGMPKAAFNIGAVEKQAALQNIPDVICSMLS